MLLSGEFADTGAAVAAIATLKARGFEADNIDLFSAEPVDLPAGALTRPSRMSLAAVAGAVTICLLAMAFVYYTQRSYPLVTGGMPVFSFWATGVIFFEMTMLGAIAATFLAFLWESGILRRRSDLPPPPPVEPGRIWLRLQCLPEQVTRAGECFYQSGALQVKKEDLP